MCYRANTCIWDTEVPVGTTEHFAYAKVLVGTTEQIHYTEVPVGTTGLILILQNLYLFYQYGSTRKYYITCTNITDTEVPVGTTELILILLIRKYP